MARYFFHLHNDLYVEDEEGRECADFEEAQATAFAEARVMASSSVRDGHLDLSHGISVTDERGQRVMFVRFGDAVEVVP